MKIWTDITDKIVLDNWDNVNPDPMMICGKINAYLIEKAEEKTTLITSWRGMLFTALRLKLINQDRFNELDKLGKKIVAKNRKDNKGKEEKSLMTFYDDGRVKVEPIYPEPKWLP